MKEEVEEEKKITNQSFPRNTDLSVAHKSYEDRDTLLVKLKTSIKIETYL